MKNEMKVGPERIQRPREKRMAIRAFDLSINVNKALPRSAKGLQIKTRNGFDYLPDVRRMSSSVISSDL